LNFVHKTGWRNGTRFIKDQDNIHKSVALLSRAIPTGDNSKDIGVKGSEIEEIHSHSGTINCSARKSIGNISPNRRYWISTTNSKFSASIAIDGLLVAGGSQSITGISRNGSSPSLGITNGTAV